MPGVNSSIFLQGKEVLRRAQPQDRLSLCTFQLLFLYKIKAYSMNTF